MKRIDVPGVGLVDFPDSMTDADITSAIESDILKAPSQASTPKAPERTFGGTVKEAASYIKDNALRLPLAIADELRTKSVVDGMDGKEVKPDQAADKSFKKVIEANKKPNTLNKGAEIVDGFSGVAKVGLNRGYAGLGKMEAGLIKSIADITDSETLAKIAENQNAYAKEVENRAVLRGTPVEGFAKESIVQDLPEAGANAISSVINTAPALVVGAASGGSALPALAGGVFLQEFNEGREKDLSPLQSAFRAAPMTVAEVVGEKLGGFDKLTKGLNKAVKGNGIAELGTAMLESSLKELPAEEFTTTLQFLVDKTPEIGLNQNATFEDYKQAVKDTALATILQSSGMGAGGAILTSIATKLDAPAGTKEAAQIDAKLLAAFNASQQKQQDEAKTAEADNALANITNPDATVEDAIALAEKALDIPAAPGLLNSITDTDLLTQVQGATEAINAADILGDDNVSNTNDAATGLATGSIEGADNQPQGSLDDLSLQPGGSGLGNTTDTLTPSEPGNVATGTGSNTDSTLDRPFAQATDDFLPQMRSMTTDATVISKIDAELALRGITNVDSVNTSQKRVDETAKDVQVNDVALPESIEVAGEKINKEWTAFNPDTGTLNIPRSEMPQIKAEHRGAMVNFLNARGISHEQETVPASSLKPTQQEFSEAKVKQASEYVGGDRSILVSSDNHVLDGHHQWLSKLQNNDNVDVIRLNAPIKDLLTNVSEFPSAQVAAGAKEVSTPKPKSVKPKAPKIKSLLTTINDLGGILNSEKLDITGEQRGFAPGGYNKIFKLNSKRSLKGLIEGGDLDEYLPYNMRLEANGANDDAFDSTEAYDYLADRIRNGESVLPYAVEEELKALQYEGNAVADVADELTEDEINGQLQQASNEERESATNARVFNTDSENGGARSSERTESATETNTDQQAEVAPESKQDLLGDDTAAKQAIADAERAKDTKRNSGNDNQDTFTLTGSNSEADQAAAAGAQDLFAAPKAESNPQDEVVKATESLTAAGVKGKEKLDTIKDVREGKVTADEVADAYAAPDSTEVNNEADAAPVGRITDFGEKLEGAKKDLWKSYQKAMADELPADAKDITLSKHFPEPDYDNLIASGMDIKAIAAIKAMRDEIPSKPKMPSKVRRWGAELGLLRDLSNKLINQEYGIDTLLSDMRANTNLSKFVDRIEMYAELGFPAMKSAKGYNITGGWTSFKEGVPENEKQTALEYPNGKREYFKDRQNAIDALRAKLEIAPEGATRKTKLDVYRVTRTGEIMIGKKVASNKYIDLKGGFKTPKEAFQFYADNEADLLQLLEQSKNVRPERRSVNNPRVGIDYRLGQDVTPEKFAAEFGFRGVQFGNYVEQARRPRDLNNAYDALLDLANVIGVPPRAISLNGTLGLAFGARGSGGKNPAAAHFERGEVVINLTKVNGFGSLGHEWFHAMDNYFSKARGDNEYLTQNPQQKRTFQPGAGFSLDESIRTEMLTAFKNLMDAIRKSDYYTRSSKIDNTRTNDYWSTKQELAARAFEAYLIAKSKEAGKSNDYLANIEDEDVYEIANQAARDFGAFEDPYPYPTRAEQAEINPMFDALFAELKTKEADDGNVVLFSRNNATENIPDAIILNDLGSAKNSNDYELAKSGDVEAATRLAKLLVTDDVINQLKQLAKESDFIAGVTSIESTGNNALPEAAALLISEKLDVPYDENIVQSTSPKRTGMNGLDRIFNRPMFEGEVIDGAGYIFVDDTITQGGTFAALSAHVKDGGGNVIANIALTGKQYSSKIALSEDALKQVRDKFGDLENEFKQSTGYGYEGLTASEARYLTSGISLNKFRDRIAQESQKTASDTNSQVAQNDLENSSLSRGISTTGLPKTSVQKTVKAIRANWKNAPEIIVVDDMNDPAIRKAVREENDRQLSQGAAGQPEGFFDAGKVYIVASEMNSAADVVRVMFHETLGHYGLRGTFGKELSAILDRVALLRKADMTKKAKQYGLDLTKVSDKRIAAEEVLAEMAQTAPQLGFVKSAIVAIRKFLRSIGVKLELSDNEIINDYIIPARSFVVNGANKQQSVSGMVAAFNRDQKDISFGVQEIPEADAKKLVMAWTKVIGELGDTPYRYPVSMETDLDKVAKEVSEGIITVTKVRNMDGDDETTYIFKSALNKNVTYVTEKDNNVWVNIADSKEGDGGSLLYTIIGNYAANNGKVFIGDPEGITSAAIIRRMVNMASLATKFGATDFIKPHKEQLQELGKYGLSWKTGDDQFNLAHLLFATYNVTKEQAPGIENVEYNRDTGDFTNTITGEQFTDDDFEKLAQDIRGNVTEGAAGRGTLKIAATIGSILRESEYGRSQLASFGLGNGSPQLRPNRLEKALYSRSNPQSSLTPSWAAPSDSKMDNVVYALQDKNIDLKRVTSAIKAAGTQISDRWNAYLQEELYHGRTAKRTQDFIKTDLEPLIEDMRMRGVAMADFEEYLWARHAPERNKQIASINPKMPDGGSGMSTQDALDYMANLSAADKTKYEALARRIDLITRKSRQVLIDYGLESTATIAAWEGAYQHYIPLMREDMDAGFGNGTGQGFSVKGNASKRATGSNRAVVDVIANIAQQYEKNIIRGEKNRVATALIGLAKLNPNADFWEVDTPPKIKTIIKGGTVYDVLENGLKVAEFTNKNAARNFVNSKGITGYAIDERQAPDYVDYVTDPNYKNRNNVVVARIVDKLGKIQERSVIFNQFDERAIRMAESIKNLDQDQISHLLAVSSSFTRYFASINTQYNPVFGIINITRDVQGALLNLSSTPIADKKAEVLGNTLKALKGIYQDVRAQRKTGVAASNQWATLFEEFQREGGQTGYRNMYANAKDRGEALRDALDPTWWKDSKLGKVISFNGMLATPEQWIADKAIKPIFDWLSDYNNALENAVRLSVYKSALDAGQTKQQAASIAKNISVNFNRKGSYGRQIGSLYAFFNASVQGTARIGETMMKRDNATGKMTFSKAGVRIMQGGLLLGAMQALALAAAGYDEDEPPQFIRDRNLIIPLDPFGADGKYVSIPMPLGYNAIPSTGRMLTEFILSGGKNPSKRVIALLNMLLDVTNPIGNAGLSMQTISPTVLDPFAALSENKDFTGRPISREDLSSLSPTPGFTRSRDKAWDFSVSIAQGINWLTGGTDATQGAISPTADQIEYLAGQFTGGVGRETIKLGTTVDSLVTGEELPTYKIPLFGRLYGNTTGQSSQGTEFYNNIRRLNEHQAEIKLLQENNGDLDAYLEKNPEAMYFRSADRVYRNISKLRKNQRILKEEGNSKDEVTEIDNTITELMQNFNDSIREAKEQEAI